MIYLFGASGHGLVILDILHRLQKPVQAFIDDAPKPPTWGGVPVMLRSQLQPELAEYSAIISIGNNAIRKKLAGELPFPQYATAVHPTAIIADGVSVGEGTVVMAGAIVNPAVSIGKHVIINTGACVDHECSLGNFVHISPNATLCGEVKVGDGAWVGAGAVIIPGVRIGAGSVVGAGAVVLRDVAPGTTVVGNPARVIA